jgi:putative ABC transport system substrate-binding protein
MPSLTPPESAKVKLSADRTKEVVAGFHQGLSEKGYFDGQNIAIEYRWTEGRTDRLPELLDDLFRRQVSVIVALAGVAGAVASKAATKSIPIVFAAGIDPVAAGLVTSLERPGSNVTGVTVLNGGAEGAKRLELLHEMVPAATLIAYFTNPSDPVFSESETRELQRAAQALGVHLSVLKVSNPGEFEAAFATLANDRAQALIVGGDVFFFNHSDQLVSLAARHRVPVVYHRWEIAKAGGLMSYGPDFADAWRLAGNIVGRVLNGEKPADIPVQQSAKIEFFLNRKTASTLGISVPAALLARADHVIE